MKGIAGNSPDGQKCSRRRRPAKSPADAGTRFIRGHTITDESSAAMAVKSDSAMTINGGIREDSAYPPPPAGPPVTRTRPTLWTRLPLGGWQVGFWADAEGRALIDVADADGTLAYRLGAARRAAPSIDAGWAGCARSADGSSQCWALAIGHAPPGRGHVISFSQPARPGGDRMTLPLEAQCGFWITHNGLWAAAATGCYAQARLTAQSATYLYPLALVA
jgi:hypothetical protein